MPNDSNERILKIEIILITDLNRTRRNDSSKIMIREYLYNNRLSTCRVTLNTLKTMHSDKKKNTSIDEIRDIVTHYYKRPLLLQLGGLSNHF